MSESVSCEVYCGLCAKPINFPNADYAWASDGIYHGFCYENPHLYQDESQEFK